MKIHELLKTREEWVKGIEARDKDGNTVFPTDPRAVCWCLIGAIQKCYKDECEQSRVSSLIREACRCEAISEWNDHEDRTFDEVKQLVVTLDI